MNPLSAGPTIRLAALDDLEALVKLEEASFQQDRMSRRSLRSAIGRETATVVVVEYRPGVLVASAVVFWDRRRSIARLYSIAVAEPCRGTGIGRILMADVVSRARAFGSTRLRLEARVGPDGPTGFYRRLGFHTVATLPAYYEDGGDGVRMERSLRPQDSGAGEPILLVDRSGAFLPEDLQPMVRTVREYVSMQEAAPGRRVINLAQSYEMLTKGYYASLLAEARGEECIPHASDLLDINWKRLHRQALIELEPWLRRCLEPGTGAGCFDVHFGQTADARLAPLAVRLFERFRCPVLRVHHDADGALIDIEALRADQADPAVFLPALRQYLGSAARFPGTRKHALAIAMLVDPHEAMPPSDSEALAHFEEAALELGARITRVSRRDLHRLAQFDALFIRETTGLDHHTYRFARKAALEGLRVIDSPEAILRCSNKIWLHERLSHAGVPMPRTIVFDRRDLPFVAAGEAWPMVLKIPDGSFSRGVHLVRNADELVVRARALFARSDLLLLQEFMPTAFDWRIGVLNGAVLFACRYHMAPEHWQIYNHAGDVVVGGDADTVAPEEVPPGVLEVAIRAADAVGTGLFGVDLKVGPRGPVVIEVNDNPNIDGGVEDALLGRELYRRVIAALIDPIRNGTEGSPGGAGR